MKFKGIKNQIKKTARFVIAVGFIVFMTCVTVYADDDVTWQTDPGKVVLDDPPVALFLPGLDHVVTRANVYEEANTISYLGMSVEEFLEIMTQGNAYIYAWDYDYTKEFRLHHLYVEADEVVSLNGMTDEEIGELLEELMSGETMPEEVEIFDGEVYSSLTGDKYYLCRWEAKTPEYNSPFYMMITIRENHMYFFYLTNLYGEASKQELKDIVDSVEYFDELAKDPSRADAEHQSAGSKWWIILVYNAVPGVIALIVVGIVMGKKKKRAKKEQAEAMGIPSGQEGNPGITCPECGKQLTGIEGGFCKYCGTKITPAQSYIVSKLGYVRYSVEHNVLRDCFFEDAKTTFSKLLHEDGVFSLYDTAFRNANMDNPYKKEDFEVKSLKDDDGITLMMIKLPNPEYVPLCYRIYLVFDNNLTKKKYFTIERGAFGGFLCSWDKDVHYNYSKIERPQWDDDIAFKSAQEAVIILDMFKETP